MQSEIKMCTIIGLMLAFCLAETSIAGRSQRTRRSQRVRMQQVQVASPDGNVVLAILPNAERLSFTVTLTNTVVIDPSTIAMNLDGYDLSSGVVLVNMDRYEIDDA